MDSRLAVSFAAIFVSSPLAALPAEPGAPPAEASKPPVVETQPAREGPSEGAKPPRPNIVLILADDLGYGELGCYGGQEIPTPNIDSLARQGIRLTSGYVSCPVCSPTRAGLLTGRYQQRFGHEFNGGPSPQGTFGLPLSETTLADRLRAVGYRTGIVGKWHLGDAPEYLPQRRGFEEFFGFLGGAHPYSPLREQAKARPKAQAKAASAPRGAILRGNDRVVETEYLTDALTREAVAYVKRHAKEPFFLYLSYNAVHSPLQAPPKYLDRFRGITAEKRRTFAAMLSALDDGVGAVLAALRDAGIERNSLVVFLSDNGGPTPSTTSGNGSLRGFKAQVLEGGIRVPFIVQWPARLPAGKTYDAPAMALDIVPTALAVAGAELPPVARVDGVDLLPYLMGTASGSPHETLFWRFGAQGAVRKGSWKLLRQRARGGWQLYDLASDIRESKDLAAQKPEVTRELQAAWESWNQELAPPLWGQGGARPAAKRPQPKRQAR